MIDVSKLNNIIEINITENYIIVEPLCEMQTIMTNLIKYNRSLPVVPEFKNITIGGTIAGGGLESSSYMYGQVQHNITSYDILGDGKLLTVSKDNYPDLFYGSCGH